MKNNISRIFSFPASADTDAEFLILGSMPGEESLRRRQYYAHPKNSFWKIMGSIFGFNQEKTAYHERLTILRQNKTALWDVTHSCVRPGSMDSDITEAKLNDFDKFFSKHPSVKLVLCNGQTSFRIFSKYAQQKNLPLKISPMPSTSPAFASMKFEEKLKIWHAALTEKL